MSGSTKQTNFGSRLGFILASAGSAVGLGAIWKFPYMAGTNGGAVFMLPYIFFTVTVGMALLLAEFAMGRAGRSGPVGSLNNVCGKPWGIFGGIGVFTVFLILSFYSIVGGWCLKYTADAATGAGLKIAPEQLGSYFGAFVSDGVSSYLMLLLFLFITAIVVLRGIDKGLLESAEIDGAGIFRRTLGIIIPMVSPTLFFLVVTQMAKSMMMSSLALIFTNSATLSTTANIDTMISYMYKQAVNNLNYNDGYATAIIAFIMTFILMLISFRFEKKGVHYN